MTKLRYRDMAKALKEQHGKDHPQYQYQPRKPSEKKRRMTRGKVATSSDTSTLGSPTDASNADPGQLVASASAGQSGNTATQTGNTVATVPAPAQVPEVVNDANPGSSSSITDVVDMGNFPEWIDEGNGIFSLDCDAPEEVIRERLEEFNENIAEPDPNDLEFDIPVSPIAAMPNVETELDNDFYHSITDWEFYTQLYDAEVNDEMNNLGFTE